MLWNVLIASTITALFTGLGAVPFLFIKGIDTKWLGIGNAIAAGLMLGASIGLVIEGSRYSIIRVSVGIALGLVSIILTRKWLEGREHLEIGALAEADIIKMLLIIGIMTVHSFAEGVGVGVSFGGGQEFGTIITTAIAIHNIPEGLAISLVLIPRGVSVARAAGWSVFSSLPQPLMAVPAFLFVLWFRPFLPLGLGLAAGAMIWMVFRELLPESTGYVPKPTVGIVIGLATIAMFIFQFLIT